MADIMVHGPNKCTALLPCIITRFTLLTKCRGFAFVFVQKGNCLSLPFYEDAISCSYIRNGDLTILLPSNQFMGLAQQMLTKNIAYNIHVELAFIAPPTMVADDKNGNYIECSSP